MPIYGRRAFLGGAASFWACSVAADGPRLAIIDWAMLETALMLGHTPVAACELERFRTDIEWPTVPDGVIDLGLRGAPNMELIQTLQPNLILSSPWYERMHTRLRALAPVLSVAVYNTASPPFSEALNALHVVGERLGASGLARRTAENALAELEATAGRISEFRDRPIYVVDIGDARHFRAFGPDSMFGDVLDRLGFENAWKRPSEFAFSAPVPLERLAERPDARILAVAPIPIEARAALRRSVLWNRLEPVAEGRFGVIGTLNPFGGVPAGLLFARFMANALIGGSVT
ncbi:MAG: ABC transporter substrate-binding protein [Pseudomonadota bacterium]